MAQANSDNAGVNATLDRFFSVLNPNSSAGTYKNVNILMNDVFCPVGGGYPWVGIANHGPQFRGADVRGLYEQIFTSFPDIWWGPSTTYPKVTAVPRLYSNDAWQPPTVGVQTTMVGTLQQPWFQDAQRYSLPLSAIKPMGGKAPTNVPSFAVFVFGAKDSTRVSQVSFYMDRYNQMRDVQPEEANDFDTDFRLFLKELQDNFAARRLVAKTQSDLSRLVETLDVREKKKR
jgi:hypothetical protein